MRSKPLGALQMRLVKLAAARREAIRLGDFTNVRLDDITIAHEPFPHIVVDDFFKPNVHAAFRDQFEAVKHRGYLESKDYTLDRFHRFDVEYDGYVYTPPATLDPQDPISVFFTLQWNSFFSSIFDQHTTLETNFAFHHHPPGDRTGFVHHDFVDKLFDERSALENGVLWGQGRGARRKRRRIISLIYFLDGDGWQESDGGETGLYSADHKTLLKKIEPLDNRLFAFHISPRSMHAFQENRRERNSFIQWFHTEPELLP